MNYIEKELAATEDNYKVIGISTCHLSKADQVSLDELAQDEQCNMVMKRDTGWFVKLYEEKEYNDGHAVSDNLKALLGFCFNAGYRMIEFDADASQYEYLTLYQQ